MYVTRGLLMLLLSYPLACGGKQRDEPVEPGTAAWWDENADVTLIEGDPEQVVAACAALEEELRYAEAFCEYSAVLVASAASADDEAFQSACAEFQETCIEEQIFDVSLCFDPTTLSPDCTAEVGDFRDCLTHNTKNLAEYGTCASSLGDLAAERLELLPSCERLLLCQE